MGVSVHKELVASNNTSHLVSIRQIVAEAATESNFDESETNRIVLAVDEAVSNVIEHAYEDCEGQSGDIQVTIDADDTKFEVIIADNGKQFDPGNIDEPDIVEHVKQGKKKGLGIFLMRQIMDEVKYTFVQGVRNELRLVKYFRREGGED